jgi:hypothetical protein
MNFGSLCKHCNSYNTNSAHITPTYTPKSLSTFLVPFLIYLPHLPFSIICTYFPELSFKTSHSSKHHTFYLKTASNIESLSQLQLKTNKPPTFHYRKLPELQQKLNRLHGIMKKNTLSSTYHKIYNRKRHPYLYTPQLPFNINQLFVQMRSHLHIKQP